MRFLMVNSRRRMHLRDQAIIALPEMVHSRHRAHCGTGVSKSRRIAVTRGVHSSAYTIPPATYSSSGLGVETVWH
jgi:hypothetical protein